jgi:nucleotide-binding universal stress UspA family protein
MIALKRILVPHDFSETSDAAVTYGIALARNFHAQLYFLNVSDQAQSDMETEFPLGLDSAVQDAARERLLKIVTPQEQTQLRPEFTIRSGSPSAEIVRYANENNVDLIVMGTHGRGFVGHVVLGSVAEKVVRTAPCPVLTVRNPHRGFVVPDEVGASVRARA